MEHMPPTRKDHCYKSSERYILSVICELYCDLDEERMSEKDLDRYSSFVTEYFKNEKTRRSKYEKSNIYAATGS